MSVVTEPSVEGNTPTRIFYRYRDLKRMGIVGSWPTLLRWVKAGAFPPGVWLGPNVRAWPKEDIDAWMASRPSAAKTEAA